MKKAYGLIVVVLVSFFSCRAWSQELASRDPQPRNVVLEEFTGIHCGYCPDGHKIAKELAGERPGRVVIIAVHAGSWAKPYPGEPDYRTNWGDSLVAQSGLKGFPSANINRQIFPGEEAKGPYYPYTEGKIALGRGGWARAAKDSVLNGSISPVNLGMKTKWTSSTRELEITVEMYLTSDVADNPKLNVALLESHAWGPQVGGKPDPNNYENNHILRDLLTGQWGEEINATKKGSVITRTYKYTVSEQYVIENCEIAAFVTHNDNFNIYTGIERPATTPKAAVIITGDSLAAKSKDETFESTLILLNKTEEEITFTCNITKSARTPADWSAGIVTGPGEVTLGAGKAADFKISLTPGETIGIGDAELVAYEKNNPDGIKYKARITAVSKETRYLEINAGGTMDTLLKDVRSGFVSLPVSDAKIVDADLKNLKVIMYNTGANYGINEAGANYISEKIRSGVGMLFAGSVTLTKLLNDAPGHEIFSQLGVSGNKDDEIKLSNYYILGANKDPVADGLSLYMSTEDNGNNYLMPVTITNPQKTVRMTYCPNVSKTVSVRVTNDKQRAIYLGFHIDAMYGEAEKSDLIKKSIDWIEGLLSAEELDYGYAAAMSGMALTVAPNPATANSVIKYKLNAKSPKSMSLVLMNEKGQAVDQIWPGTAAPGEGTISFDFSKYAQGAYYLMLSSGKKTVTVPVRIGR